MIRAMTSSSWSWTPLDLHDLNLHAATMEAVLEAHENRTNHVTARYLLTFDQELSAYKLQEVPV